MLYILGPVPFTFGAILCCPGLGELLKECWNWLGAGTGLFGYVRAAEGEGDRPIRSRSGLFTRLRKRLKASMSLLSP